MLRILVPTDFSDTAYAAMRTALQLARSYHAEVTFLHAMERPMVPAATPQEVYYSILQAAQQELGQRLQQLSQQLHQELDLRPKEVTRRVQILPTPVSNTVLQLIRDNSINLVVMGSSGVSSLKKFFMGSNTAEMIRITTVPLLIVPARYAFRGFKSITVVIRAKRFGNRPGLSILDRLSHTFSASVYFLFILDEDGQARDSLPLAESAELVNGLNYEIIPIRKNSKNEELEQHLQKTNTDLLVWLPRQVGGWGDSLSEGFTEEIAYKARLPLLVIPHLDEEE
ncbi:universal stress protein [Pontibacter kalidii]|uniref:universal stress protein n=1 Tax=Pontibacter kalidii TaxID=2592049 RepID=UPI0022591170|nr:universal stress protein [Pontibacter kalidii]